MVTEPAGELPEIRKREVSERLEQICPYHTGLLQICTGTRYLPFTVYIEDRNVFLLIMVEKLYRCSLEDGNMKKVKE